MGWTNIQAMVVVPLSFALVAVITLAFEADPNAAASFFGSFTAALVAAISAIAGWIYQSQNTVAAEQRAKNAIRDERGVFIFGYLQHVHAHLGRAKEMIGRAKFTVPEGAEPSGGDKTTMTVKGLRRVFPPIPLIEITKLIEYALAFDPQLALAAVREIDQAALESVIWRFEAHADDTHLKRSEIDTIISRLEKRTASLKELIEKLQTDLRSRNVLT